MRAGAWHTEVVVTTVINVIAVAAGVGGIVGLLWIAWRGDPERAKEDDARAFFDRNGHWPDEAGDGARRELS
jgi:hypothetical protein